MCCECAGEPDAGQPWEMQVMSNYSYLIRMLYLYPLVLYSKVEIHQVRLSWAALGLGDAV